jgi:hypothetical protein
MGVKSFQEVDMFQLVEEFMTEFDLKGLNSDTADLYFKLVIEEAAELHEATEEDHIEKEACDLLVTVCGLILAKTKNIGGIQDFFTYVHRSNMTKRSDTYEEVEEWCNRMAPVKSWSNVHQAESTLLYLTKLAKYSKAQITKLQVS